MKNHKPKLGAGIGISLGIYGFLSLLGLTQIGKKMFVGGVSTPILALFSPFFAAKAAPTENLRKSYLYLLFTVAR